MIPRLVRWVKGSSIATTVEQVTARAWIQSPVWELPYAKGVAIEKQKQKQKNTGKYKQNKSEDQFQLKSCPTALLVDPSHDSFYVHGCCPMSAPEQGHVLSAGLL